MLTVQGLWALVPRLWNPRNWKPGDPIAGRMAGGGGSGSGSSGRKGGAGKPWVRSGRGQAHNTEVTQDEPEDVDNESEVAEEEEEQGKE